MPIADTALIWTVYALLAYVSVLALWVIWCLVRPMFWRRCAALRDWLWWRRRRSMIRSGRYPWGMLQ